MRRISVKSSIFLLLAAGFAAGISRAGEQPRGGIPKGLEGIWDPAKYISIDEIQPGMEAYCLTVFKGVEPEKFPLVVRGVVRDFQPGKNAIFVEGTDERFKHTGPVAGCSGSPVYIEGRLAGALAFGWTFSKDPFYGVTPIEEMLGVGKDPAAMSPGIGLSFDYSAPIDLKRVEQRISMTNLSGGDSGPAAVLPSPLIVSGLPESMRADLESSLGPMGFMVAGGQASGNDVKEVNLTPGGCLAIPLITGDITIDAVGTVTDIRGDDVYGFGHSLLGYGDVNLPMAAGEVHTVMSGMMRSFKIASATGIVGALTTDESTAVRGKIGAKARMIPVTVKVKRYNQTRTFNCQIADNRILTPTLLRITISAAVFLRGDLPPDNTIQYKTVMELDDAGTIVSENISTGTDVAELIRDSVSPAALLLNNPYRKVQIKSVVVDVQVEEKNVTGAIWSAELSKSQLKAGENFDVKVVTETFQGRKRSFTFDFAVPENTPAGSYPLIICGGAGYEEFLRKTMPQRFTVENLDSLVSTLNEILAISRDELHCMLVLPGGGIALEKAELPQLPATKALVLGDAKRAVTMQAYPGWIEKKVRTDSVIMDQKVMNITVEK